MEILIRVFTHWARRTLWTSRLCLQFCERGTGSWLRQHDGCVRKFR